MKSSSYINQYKYMHEDRSMFEDVRAAVEKMNTVAPRPNISNLELSDSYDMKKDWPNEYWPGVNNPGVYAFADEEGNTVYIGKASCNTTVGYRLGSYWKNGPENIAVPLDDKATGVRWVATITVDHDNAFEIPAIEEWLIRELSSVISLRNTVGK